tara:strand:+ start:1375 stop:1512 length:138 start_codon:yes stop_codon:yes gene_type:complete
MKTDYTLEWLDFWNYELTKKIEELKEKLEKRKKELGSENTNEFNE